MDIGQAICQKHNLSDNKHMQRKNRMHEIYDPINLI